VNVVLEVKNLKVSYGRIEALKGVSMRIERGEFVGVIGANGAGKTSLLMALSGAVRAKGGSVVLDGRDVTYLPQHQRVGSGIAIVPEGRQVFGPLTVMENLELGGFHRRGASRIEIARDQEMMLELFPILRRRARLQKVPLGATSCRRHWRRSRRRTRHVRFASRHP